MEVRGNFRVSPYASTFTLLYTHPNSMSLLNPQRWRNGERRCMPLMNQLLTGSIIEFGIHVVFPLTEKF